MVSEDDKRLVLALVARYQLAFTQDKADRKLKAELEERLVKSDAQMSAMRNAVSAFGFDTEKGGWFYPIRDALGPDRFDKAMRDAGAQVTWGSAPTGYVVENPPDTNIPPPLGPDASVRELVLERLEIAGREGIKADAIRQYIEGLRGIELHYKTIGMTLYRLSQEKLARRDGRTWFYAKPSGEAKNPGAVTPGSINRDTKEGEEP